VKQQLLFFMIGSSIFLNLGWFPAKLMD
jgi:hypothetical protein